MEKQLSDKMALIADSLGMASLTPDQLADQFIHAREAVMGLQMAVRSYFAFKNDPRGGSRIPIDLNLTTALWQVDKYLGEPRKLADKAERARRKANNK